LVSRYDDLDTQPAQKPSSVDTNDGALDQELLRVKDVANLLGVHPNTVRIWTERGVLRSYRVGPRRDRRIPLAAVRLLLQLEGQ
jgi:excisionase family DNA binding protein